MKYALCIAAIAAALAGCSNDAQVASANLSQAADNFQIERRIVFVDTWTGNYLLSIEGLCSIDKMESAPGISVTCKTGPTEYKKHFLGLNGNVSFFAEQVVPNNTNIYHYQVTFKPETIVPTIQVR